MNQAFKKIPSMDVLMKSLEQHYDRMDAVYVKYLLEDSVKDVKSRSEHFKLDQMSRNEISTVIIKKVEAKISSLLSPSFKHVINGTGVILHTGLGRAPLDPQLINQLREKSGYTNLEIDLSSGKRGERLEHISPLLQLITGAEDAVVVNNNAAAVFLILNSVTRRKEVIISRGELVEIGGSFRMPEVMKQSGCKMIEVGSTNKTHLSDYTEAINDRTAAIMIVHPSNYKIVGFTQKPDIKDILDMAHKYNIPVIYDLGSGAFVNMQKYGFEYEPVVRDVVTMGFDLICFSGDKLLGGPQAGIIVGKKNLIKKIKKNHLLRILRCDKVILNPNSNSCYPNKA
jgi:L-seryl-tRNA(Ser) seleniumtransferase